MAYNQASFFLFPPRFSPIVEFDHTAKTVSGKPLEMIGTELVDAAARIVSTEELIKWFLARGFSEKERYGGLQILFHGRCATPFGAQELIELGLPLDEDEIQELYIRFLLTETTPLKFLRGLPSLPNLDTISDSKSWMNPTAFCPPSIL
jgi:hypothetical protein